MQILIAILINICSYCFNNNNTAYSEKLYSGKSKARNHFHHSQNLISTLPQEGLSYKWLLQRAGKLTGLRPSQAMEVKKIPEPLVLRYFKLFMTQPCTGRKLTARLQAVLYHMLTEEF